MSRFLIVGLPRSGTTYLMSLLNSHRDVLCEGEQFNPHSIVGAGWVERSPEAVTERDKAPVAFLNQFYQRNSNKGAAVGCKWMIGHHAEIMGHIPNDHDLRLIYVHRENKLAQTSSLMKALQTKQWATRDECKIDRTPIDAGPFQVAQKSREMEVQDMTFARWLDTVPDPVLRVEYRDMFKPGFEATLCDFLGVTFDPAMKSPLVKQGSADILARFAKKKAISNYFTETGKADWLQAEI